SFEIDPEEGKYYPLSTYNEIVEYGVFDKNEDVINIVSAYVDDEIVDIDRFYVSRYSSNTIGFSGFIPSPDGDILIDSYIDDDGNWFDDASDINDNVNIKLAFEVTQPPQLTGINATLILLIPLVFVGGLLYFYKPLKKD